MSRVSEIISLLTSLTDSQIAASAPAELRRLQDQLERVQRIVSGTTIARSAGRTPPEGASKRGKAAFLDELRDGRGRD